MKPEAFTQGVVDWLIQHVRDFGAEGVAFGMSEGVDSAVLGAIAKRAFPEHHTAILLTSDEEPGHKRKNTLALANALGLNYSEFDIDLAFHTIIKAMPWAPPHIENDLKARIRMAAIHYRAQSKNYLVLGSLNRSEMAIGYYTEHAEEACHLLPLANLTKREVYELASYLAIPPKVMERTPSTGHFAADGKMGFTYEELDQYILQGSSPAQDRIEAAIKKAGKKGKPPLIYMG